MSRRKPGEHAVTRRGALSSSHRRAGVLAAVVGVVAVVVIATLSLGGAKPGSAGDPPSGPPPSPVPPPAEILTPHSNMPDPFVLYHDGRYYLYSSNWGLGAPNVPVRESSSLTGWSPATDAMPKMPAWAVSFFTWAPDVRRYGPHDYVLYFTAMRSHPPYDECIGAATGASPVGPFKAEASPMICQLDDFGSIDPRTFVDHQGRLWMLWKSDNDHGGASQKHTWIFSQRLAPGGLRLVGPRYRLLTNNQHWEGPIVEAPAMLYHGGVYWLFYSGNWFNKPGYGIGVARCASVAGPCTKPLDRPWLGSGPGGRGPGEASVFVGPAGHAWLLYGPWCYGCVQSMVRPVAMMGIAFDSWGPYPVSPTKLTG